MVDSSVAITAGTGTPVRVLTALGAAVAGQQVMSLADQYGNLAPSIADGTPTVDTGPTSVFIDAFDSGLTNWAAVGTAPPTATNGNATFPVGTTVSATSYMGSSATFALQANTFLQITALVQIEAAVVTNSTRWWGYGVNAATPTAAAPITNGVVFIQDYTAGVFYGAVYSAGTRTQTLTLTRPSDGASHRYQILFKQSRVFFAVDGISQGSLTFPNMAVSNGLQLIAGIANFTTAPATAPTFSLGSMSMADPGKNNSTISDGVSPWRKATVKAASSAATIADTALVVAPHPSTPLPAGTNVLGSVNIGATTLLAFTTVSTASTNATSVKTSAGNLQELTISNPTATAVYFKLYNLAAAPTVGTSVPVATYRVAATGSAGDTVTVSFGPNGKRFTTGIAWALTAAAAATDTAAAVAAVQVSGTYV